MDRGLVAGVVLVALGTGVANAADLPYRPAPAPVPVPSYMPLPFTWSGFYIGGNIGAAWGQGEWRDSLFGLDWGKTSDAGLMGGGQVGFNYQMSNLVLGIEADFDWLGSQKNGVTVTGPLGHGFRVTSNDTGIGALAGRFGFAGDHILFYGKAGVSWVGNAGFTITDVTTSQAFVGSAGNAANGWVTGAGIEYAFTNCWTAKLEYDYLGLAGRGFKLPPTAVPALVADTITSSHNIQTVKLGVNYLFNWGGPVMAGY